jgi:hypothetical protein
MMTTSLPAAVAASERRRSAGLNERRAAAEHGGHHPRAPADADELHVEPFIRKIAGFFGDPGGRPGTGEARIKEPKRYRRRRCEGGERRQCQSQKQQDRRSKTISRSACYQSIHSRLLYLP